MHVNDPHCIFCKIVTGEIPCAKVYETPALLGFLDIAPINQGHVLLIPKAHHPDLWSLPAALGPDMLHAAAAIGQAMKDALGATGVNLGMNNGASAGQMVFHAHWHLIPRFDGDGLSLWPQKHYDDPQHMQAVAKALAEGIR